MSPGAGTRLGLYDPPLVAFAPALPKRLRRREGASFGETRIDK